MVCALALGTSYDFPCLALLTFLNTPGILVMRITNPHYCTTPSELCGFVWSDEMAQNAKHPKLKRPSMYDVARLAGVSQTTVSFVVNNVPDINIPQETRDRIWSAVEELGWRPNAMARGLSLQRSHTIGLISDEIATTPHAGKIIQGAQDAAWAHDKMLLVIHTGRNAKIE